MKNQRLMTALVAGVLGLALVAGASAQGSPREGIPATQVRQVRQPVKRITVQGKIIYRKDMGGYYVASKPEVYTIANQNPAVLEALVKSGKSVTIEAKPNGDLLTIEKLDGKPYKGTVTPVFK